MLNASDLTIKGDPAGGVVIDNSSHSDSIFEIDGGTVSMNRLSISGGAPYGVYSTNADLTIDHSTFMPT